MTRGLKLWIEIANASEIFVFALYLFNIRSSFTVQNPRAQLVKIDHVTFALPRISKLRQCSIANKAQKSCIIQNVFSFKAYRSGRKIYSSDYQRSNTKQNRRG